MDNQIKIWIDLHSWCIKSTMPQNCLRQEGLQGCLYYLRGGLPVTNGKKASNARCDFSSNSRQDWYIYFRCMYFHYQYDIFFCNVLMVAYCAYSALMGITGKFWWQTTIVLFRPLRLQIVEPFFYFLFNETMN